MGDNKIFLMLYLNNINLGIGKNHKPTILSFVNTSFLKIAIFHVYGSHFVFQNGRRYPNLKKNS